MTMVMQELLERECPEYFTGENIEQMKKEESKNEGK